MLQKLSPSFAEEIRATAVPALRPPRQAETVYISLTRRQKKKKKVFLFSPFFLFPFSYRWKTETRPSILLPFEQQQQLGFNTFYQQKK
jgi:hypothetical protein